MAVPELPASFPCWCKAVYSWGGESKGDLGFIEGDVIECLNAGDGSWWTGRLFRDRRSIGSFPSNFVKLMPSDWQPYRKASLQSSSRPSSVSSAPTTPSPQKTKSVFRKPFTAYENVGARGDGKGSPQGTPSPPSSISKKWKPMAPYTSMKKLDSHRAATKPSPLNDSSPSIPAPLPRASATRSSIDQGRPTRTSQVYHRDSSRAASPLPPMSRAASPQPYPSRAPSPRPHISRAASPQPGYGRSPSPQPPLPRAASPQPHFSRAASPQPYFPRAASPQPHYTRPIHPGQEASWQNFSHSRATSPHPSFARAASPQPDPSYTYYRSQNQSQAPYLERDIARSASPQPYVHSRAASPQPFHDDHGRDDEHYVQTSFSQPVQSQTSTSDQDIPFPSQLQLQRLASREPSPVPFDGQLEASPPPPPPPAHRVAYNREDSNGSSQDRHDAGYRTPRRPSPAPSDHSGMTPSPLRDAMKDVMSSLDGMGVQDHQHKDNEAPMEMWGPDDYEIVRSNSAREGRPHTSIGFEPSSVYGQALHSDEADCNNDDDGMFPQLPGRKQPPQLNTYVQRMEERLKRLQQGQDPYDSSRISRPPSPPAKDIGVYTNEDNDSRPSTSHSSGQEQYQIAETRSNQKVLRKRKSAIELGKARLQRTFTAKSTVTNASSTAQSSATDSSNGTQITSPSLMSGFSAGGFSATSAGSLARRKFGRSNSIKNDMVRPATAMSGISYHSSHASAPSNFHNEPSGLLGGLSAPVVQKRGFLRKILDTAKTTAASSRNSIATETSSPKRHSKLPNGVTGIAGGLAARDAAKEMGLGSGPTSGVDWVQMRRDVNRSNSLSKNEKKERYERCQMMDLQVMAASDAIEEMIEGDEDIDGNPVHHPTDYSSLNLSLVDKNSRFIANLPSAVNPISLAQSYLCRPYRSDVQKLRAIFTWVSERISWEEDYEGEVDCQRVILSKRGCSEEIAVLAAEMCAAVGIHAEIVRGYLKTPGENLLGQDLNDVVARPNHWWNAVLVDNEWRVMDCSLANPTNPRRAAFSAAGPSAADSWFFLARPSEIFHSHVPLLPEQQHVVPSMQHDILMALPTACPAFFKHSLRMHEFDTSQLYLEGLEMAQIQMTVPEDVECVAEVEARTFARDADGDFFESGDLSRKRALAQAEYVSYSASSSGEPWKRYTIKAVLPSSNNSSSTATLKIYAGKRGLMHGINSNPHALAVVLPLAHQGQNPEYEFFMRHPTPHALRHELYVIGPLCKKLAVNNTFVFGVRQHPANPSSAAVCGPDRRPASSLGNRPTSAMSLVRPGSAMSMMSSSASGSSYSNPSASGSDSSGGGAGAFQKEKPAKLAIQSPSGKIMRMTRKAEQHGQVKRGGQGYRGHNQDEDDAENLERLGTSWEIVVKITERGTWRGLVLADRSARWCVFGEWECL